MICGKFPCECPGMSRKNVKPDVPRKRRDESAASVPAKGNPPNPVQTGQTVRRDPKAEISSGENDPPPASPWAAALEKRAEHDQAQTAENEAVARVMAVFPGATTVKE